MKKFKTFLILFLALAILNVCIKDDETDKQKPLIDLTIQGAFPVNCDTIYFGESFVFKVFFSDNTELGSFSIDIHHNFNHHSHSTEVTECNLYPKKNPVNPFVFIQDYDIPAGLQEYETNQTISVPSGNSGGLFDEGDYHFFLRLTDKEGWSTQKGLSIKMLHR